MKQIFALLSIITLLLCINACEKEPKNKGRFEKNIPECVKEKIKRDIGIGTAEEYYNESGTKKIYYLTYKEGIWGIYRGGTWIEFPPPFPFLYDEDCDSSPVQTEDNPLVYAQNDTILLSMIATFYPNRTIEYKGNIYYFKRTVFTARK